jgi:putative PIN family toxin of toxin-antitoxin system
MRILLDANLFISFLLRPRADSASSRVVRAGLKGEYRLLLPQQLLDEFVTRAGHKPYLAARIQPEHILSLVETLKTVSHSIPQITQPIPALTRDPKDDYLIAYALVGGAEYLVTGDADLLSLGQVDRVKILTARDFLTLLGH